MQKPELDHETSIELLLPESQCKLIDRAAKRLGRCREDYILEVVCRESVEVILDQREFAINEDQYIELLRLLEHPAQENPLLKDLLSRENPWN